MSMGIPGTGLFYTASGRKKTVRRRANPAPEARAPVAPPQDRLTLGFFKRLITPDDEKALVDGCRELVVGHEAKAVEHLEKAVHLADGAYLAGFLFLKRRRLAQAEECLTTAGEKHRRLGCYFSRYGISAMISLPITDEVSAHVGPNLRGVLLGLVEVYQREGRWEEAIRCLHRLRRLEPVDEVVKLSLAELLLEARPRDKDACRKVVRLIEGIAAETPVQAGLMLYKAKALRGLGLMTAAREILTQGLRRKKGRDAELLRALRYERAMVYEALGQHRRGRAEMEKLYAEAPGYEDVAARLGLAPEHDHSPRNRVRSLRET